MGNFDTFLEKQLVISFLLYTKQETLPVVQMCHWNSTEMRSAWRLALASSLAVLTEAILCLHELIDLPF